MNKIIYEARLCELISSMTSKYCPINKGNCQSDCVHFDCGFVFDLNRTYKVIKPSCKLWK